MLFFQYIFFLLFFISSFTLFLSQIFILTVQFSNTNLKCLKMCLLLSSFSQPPSCPASSLSYLASPRPAPHFPGNPPACRLGLPHDLFTTEWRPENLPTPTGTSWHPACWPLATTFTSCTQTRTTCSGGSDRCCGVCFVFPLEMKSACIFYRYFKKMFIMFKELPQ